LGFSLREILEVHPCDAVKLIFALRWMFSV